MKNKRAWIKIVEAFVAILLVTSVLLIVLNKGYIEKKDISLKVYEIELSILREIQSNNSLRADILGIEKSELPVEWEDFELRGLSNVKNKIIQRTPELLDCKAKMCKMNETCSLNEYLEKDIYSQSVSIIATLKKLDYRQLKLFCWTK